MKTWNNLCEMYLKGAIVGEEFKWGVFTVLDESNIAEFLQKAPRECVEMMTTSLDGQPRTDEEWGRVVIAGMGWNPADTRQTLERCRVGVEAARVYLKTDELINPYCGGCGHNFFHEPKITKKEAKKYAETRRCRYCVEEMEEERHK